MSTADQHGQDNRPDNAEHAILTLADRDALNTAFLASRVDTGFWDDHGRTAPWPVDIDGWTCKASHQPEEQPGDSQFRAT